MDTLNLLVDTADFPTRWQTGIWTGTHGWVHIAADLAIFAAFLTIPLIVLRFARGQRDRPRGLLLLLIGVFLLSCGAEHLVEAAMFWWPAYRVAGLLKVVTAVAAWAAVFALVPALPTLLRTPELERVNTKLKSTLEQRDALLADRDRFLALSHDLICTASLSGGTFQSVNPSFERVLGFSQDELLSRPFLDLIHPDDVEPTRREVNSLVAGETTREFQNRYRTKDGEWVWLEWSSVPSVSEDAVYAIARDVTERHRLDDELRSALRAAEHADRAKSRFLANMSHELRTPMNAVIGTAQLLRRTPMSADQKDLVDTIQVGGDALLAVIDHVLDFSRIEAGHVSLESHVFCLRDWVEQCLDIVAVGAANKRLELTADVAPELPEFVRGDPARLRQVAVNLLANAVKFTAEGEVVLRVSGAVLEQGQFPLTCEVLDSGPGIPDSEVTHIFDAFSQVDATLARKSEGSGLGLAISKSLVHAMSGTIEVVGHDGPGTTIRFQVPVEEAEPSHSRTDSVALHLISMRILVLVEHASLRTHVMGLLTDAASACTAAASVEAALELVAQEGPFSAVVADSELSADLVHAVVRAARERAAGPTPLILLARLGQSPRSAYADLAPVTVVAKPVRRARLLGAFSETLVADELRGAAAGAALPDAPAAGPRVLVVEDNPMNQEVTLRMLRELGCRTLVATRGAEAVEIASRQHFDLILMDLQMPGLDGLESTRRIRASGGSSATTPIVALTASALRETVDACREAGMNEFVPKPVELRHLADVIATLVPPAEPEAPWPEPARSESIAGTVLDLSKLAHAAQGDAEFERRLLSMFVGEARARVDAVRTAADAGDAGAAGASAHRLKSSAAIVGAGALEQACATLEQAARDGDEEQLRSAVDALVEHADAATTAARDHLGT